MVISRPSSLLTFLLAFSNDFLPRNLCLCPKLSAAFRSLLSLPLLAHALDVVYIVLSYLIWRRSHFQKSASSAKPQSVFQSLLRQLYSDEY